MLSLFDDLFNGVSELFENIVDGTPTKRDLVKLLEAGATIYTIADATGIGVDVLQKILEED